MFSLKLALRNIIRMPKRTVINLLLLLLVAASVTSGVLVYNATGKALGELDENYTFVASMVSSTPIDYYTGSRFNFGIDGPETMTLDDFRSCFNSDDVIAYNVSINDKLLFLPYSIWATTLETHPFYGLETVQIINIDCSVVTTANLFLERGFFEGKYKMLSGGDFSDAAYLGNTSEVIIPEWLANDYGLNVGDEIIYTCDLKPSGGSNSCIKIKASVAGIYENTESPLSRKENAVYIPLQFLMRGGVMFGAVRYVDNSTNPRDFTVTRADFVLRDRDSVYTFIENVGNSGADLNRIDIVFNNAEYDMIKNGLLNVRVVVVVLVLIVSAAGLGIFVTFTANMVMSRRREKDVLRAVGMKKSGVALMFIAELLAVAFLALPIGYISGRVISGAICRYADSTVENDVNELALLNSGDETADNTLLPLSCNINISIADGTVESRKGKIRQYKPEGSAENGVDVMLVDVCDTNAKTFSEARTTEYTPIRLAVVDSIDGFVSEDRFDELSENGSLKLWRYRVYVPRSSKYRIGEEIFAVANMREIDYLSDIGGLIQPMYLVVCGYCDDSLGLESDMLLMPYGELEKTERKIYIEILPHCDMVIPTAEEK